MNFKKEAKFMLYLSIAPILIGLSAAIVGPRLLPSPCKNTILQEIQSPNKNYKIIVFSRDCGATTGFSTQVSILKKNKSIKNKAGNIFVADTDHGKSPSGPGGGPKVKANWLGHDQVEIEVYSSARVFKKNENFDGIKIIYKMISEPVG